MHILVTGASGFVGHSFVRAALAGGHHVTALTRAGSSAPIGADVLVHELGSGAPLTLPSGVDAVAHLAQSRAFRAFPGDAQEMFRVNVAGTLEVAMAAAAANVSRFCFVSSGSVYEPFTGPLTEEAPVAPLANLGASKLAGEVTARPFGALFPVSILRLFAPYGPGQSARLIPDLIRRVRSGEAVVLPHEGGGMRFSPSYVDDVCDVMLTAIEDSWSGVFNVAASDAVTIEEAAFIIGYTLDKAPVFERKALAAPSVVPDLTKLGACYDLARFRSLTDGIKATLMDDR